LQRWARRSLTTSDALFTKLTGREHASTLCGSMYIAVIADELAF
jgi:hypothetical protein